MIQTDNSSLQNINTVNVRFHPLRFPPKRYKRIAKLKNWIGCISWDIVLIDGEPLKIRGYLYNYHNLFHYELSLLERIQIGQDWVSGIHGFYSPMFHEQEITPESLMKLVLPCMSGLLELLFLVLSRLSIG